MQKVIELFAVDVCHVMFYYDCANYKGTSEVHAKGKIRGLCWKLWYQG
jgi:hypothetical protein